MAELPVLPLRVSDLLSDTNHMTAEQFGAYCRILFTMWRHGGRLPNNPQQLARIAGVDSRRWHLMADAVMAPLTVVDNSLSQKRLSATFLDVRELRSKRAKAAKTRWNGHARA